MTKISFDRQSETVIEVTNRLSITDDCLINLVKKIKNGEYVSLKIVDCLGKDTVILEWKE